MMTRFETRFLWLTTVLAGGSGLVLYVMKDWMVAVDPFAVVNHPWQPLVLKFHILTVPFLTLALGMAVSKHALRKLKNGQSQARRTGLFVLVVLVPMIVSGVLIWIMTSSTALAIAAWVHLISGAVYLAAYVAHAVLGRDRKPRESRRRPPTTAGRRHSPPVKTVLADSHSGTGH